MLRRHHQIGAAALCWLAFLSACAPVAEVNRFAPGEYPQRLSEWGVLQRQGDALALGRGVAPYDVNTPLFADYALKLRTVWMPPGRSAEYADHDAYAMPVGTIISKTFFYPLADGVAQAQEGWSGAVADLDLAEVRLLETRLLIRQADRWDATAYVWRDSEAWLNLTGAVMAVELAHEGAVQPVNYIVPSRNECRFLPCRRPPSRCSPAPRHHHATTESRLRRRSRQSDRRMLGRGWLDNAPNASARARNADWNDAGEPLAHLARSYLDANCGHCHNAAGSADHTGLWLDIRNQSFRRLGLCKPPIAAGQGTGGLRYAIAPGAPNASMLVFRMASNDPAARMPEVGRTLAHQRGLAVVSAWIESLPGECSEPDYRGGLG